MWDVVGHVSGHTYGPYICEIHIIRGITARFWPWGTPRDLMCRTPWHQQLEDGWCQHGFKMDTFRNHTSSKWGINRVSNWLSTKLSRIIWGATGEENVKLRRGLDWDNPHFYFEFYINKSLVCLPPGSKHAFNHTIPASSTWPSPRDF